jgi:hypothetical protein
MVFDKRGYVRQYVVPSNPQTTGQMTWRNTLGDIQRGLKILGAVLRAELKSEFGYRWNSMIVGELTANNGAALAAYVAEFGGFGGTDQEAWESADTITKLEVADGALLYAVTSAVYDMGVRLGATLSLTQPAAANSTTIAAEWIANS